MLHAHIPEPLDEQALLDTLVEGKVRLTHGVDVADGASVLVDGFATQEQMGTASLTTLVLPFSGMPRRTRRLLLEHRPDLRVHNMHHNADAVAEATIALTLAAAYAIVPMDTSLRSGDWSPRYQPDPAVRLVGNTAVVLGYGAIGRRVGAKLQGLGMRVVGVRRTASDPDCHPVSSLPALARHANVLVVAAPLTDETRGLISADLLASMPPKAIVVNIGRGAIIDEQALFDALQSKRLHSAALDVWWRYPKGKDQAAPVWPSTLPFHELPNVVLSPHRAGHGDDVERRRATELAQLLCQLASGEPPSQYVDVARGY